VTVAVWWVIFAQIPFYYLPNGSPSTKSRQGGWIWNGFRELKKSIGRTQSPTFDQTLFDCLLLLQHGRTNGDVHRDYFGSNELKLPDNALIVTILLLQLLAIVGAYCAAVLSGKWGNTKTISAILFIWIGVCISAYFVYTEMQFAIGGRDWLCNGRSAVTFSLDVC
jgi:UMF1 family MFS transporter